MPAFTATVSTFTWNAGSPIDAIGTVSFSAQRPALDVTQIGGANTYHVPGVLTSVLTADLYYNTADHSVLVNDLLSGTSRAFAFTANSGDVISGTGLLTGCDIVSSNQDIVRGSVSITVVGRVTIAGTQAAAGSNEI